MSWKLVKFLQVTKLNQSVKKKWGWTNVIDKTQINAEKTEDFMEASET